MEMECDLPCEDSIFNSEHPFAQPNFRFNRELTVAEAFQSLFAEVPPAVPNYTVFDMFILIHRTFPKGMALIVLLTPDSSLCLYQHPYDEFDSYPPSSKSQA